MVEVCPPTNDKNHGKDDKETKWIDAWIRWERDSKSVYDNDSDGEGDGSDDDDSELAAPTDTFSFRYEYPGTDRGAVDIQIKGFHFESEQTWNSTGLTLWRSSEYLSDYFSEQWKDGSLFSKNRRFLELGSGLGHTGIHAMHSIQLSQLDESRAEQDFFLCLTDGDTDVLQRLRDNVSRNQLPDDEHTNKLTHSCSQLLWGRDQALEFLKRDYVNNEKFDVIFGSDLVYVTKVITPLFETVATLLSKASDDSRFLMAHCSRRQGNEVKVDMVLDAAEALGLKHTVVKSRGDISLIEFSWHHKELCS